MQETDSHNVHVQETCSHEGSTMANQQTCSHHGSTYCKHTAIQTQPMQTAIKPSGSTYTNCQALYLVFGKKRNISFGDSIESYIVGSQDVYSWQVFFGTGGCGSDVVEIRMFPL